MGFIFDSTKLDGAVIINPIVNSDECGSFLEIYNICDFCSGGVRTLFVQDYQLLCNRGVLRGLHFQAEKPQAKLLRVLFGEIYAAAVDLRVFSPTYLDWIGLSLSQDNQKQLFIPEGFAHGFYTLSDTAVIAYKCNDYCYPELERGIRYDDPQFGIAWPFQGNPVLSKKDLMLPYFKDI